MVRDQPRHEPGSEAAQMSNSKLDAVFHPKTYVCDYCGAEWRSPISAAMCCDAVSMDADS
jgi:hypothetical protein